MAHLILRDYLNQMELSDFNFLGIPNRFSSTKTLYPYQTLALENAYKVLYLYFVECSGKKDEMFKKVYQNNVSDDYDFKVRGKVTNYLTVSDGKIKVLDLINRAGFWMATGSGKTLVIVKLVELLKTLIDHGKIPKKDILFLTARDDLINQFMKHVIEYNSHNENPYKLRLVPLSEFERERNFYGRLFDEEITVFYYRSDLIAEESGDKRLDFESFYNDGNWYVILDEAHKGDKSESKAQAIFTAISKNGFMFNFSATFVEELDFWTCAYEYNLSSFVRDGYGKHVFVSLKSLEGFDTRKAKNLPNEVKAQTVLKSLLLHTWLAKIKKELGTFYPKPLLLVLANSVNTEDADLQIFFEELVKIGKGEIEQKLFEKVKQELWLELKGAKCVFTDKTLHEESLAVLSNLIYDDVLAEFFNTTTPSKIEVRLLAENKQELSFALKTGTKPFGIIKIGDITTWLKEKLRDYDVIETFSQDSYFQNLNELEEINLLMGSRAFYEGWDSPRPNIILYLNIGKDGARKFVLQSLGRGVRILPVSGKARRIEFLDEKQFVQIEKAKALEFLYVFGTKADAVQRIVSAVQEERKNSQSFVKLDEGLISVNPQVRNKVLLVPVYRIQSEYLKAKLPASIEISNDDYSLIVNYIQNVPEVVLIFRHSLKPSLIKMLRMFLLEKRNIRENSELTPYRNPDLIIERLVKALQSGYAEVERVSEVDEQTIVHFTQIKVLEGKAEKVKKFIELSKQGKDRSFDGFKILRLDKHYYQPVILVDDTFSKVAQHVVKHKSEIEFVAKIDETEETLFNDFEWWYFSKIDETTDKVYIPYYEGTLRYYFPDFIFWLKKQNLYVILFVDPKGTAHASTYRKIDGYKLLFEKDGKPKIFEYGGMQVIVLLAMYNKDLEKVPDEYRDYWVKSVDELEEFVKRKCSPEI